MPYYAKPTAEKSAKEFGYGGKEREMISKEMFYPKPFEKANGIQRLCKLRFLHNTLYVMGC